MARHAQQTFGSEDSPLPTCRRTPREPPSRLFAYEPAKLDEAVQPRDKRGESHDSEWKDTNLVYGALREQTFDVMPIRVSCSTHQPVSPIGCVLPSSRCYLIVGFKAPGCPAGPGVASEEFQVRSR